MSKFKAGDLALIVNSHHEENLGVVVELIRFDSNEKITLEDGRKVANPNGLPCWEIEADRIRATSSRKPEGFYTSRAAIAERDLMPLRGDFQPEQQKAKEEIA